VSRRLWRIRALCYHAPPPSGHLEEYMSKLRLSCLEEIAARLGDVWTLRVVSPPVESARGSLQVPVEKYIEAFYEASMRAAGYVAFPVGRDVLPLVPELALSFERAYFSAQYSDDLIDSIARVFYELPAKAGWVAGSRFAVSFGEPPVTPYFPATRSGGEGLSISLLYPGYLLSMLERGYPPQDIFLKLGAEVNALVLEALRGTPVPLIGVDYSLSPWMEESVARVVESISGAAFGSPGTLAAVHELNNLIRLCASAGASTGFNEVMLPVAEDNRLKELADGGLLGLRDLVSYTSVCVAGLDMVALPSSIDYNVLRGLLRDLNAIHAVKGKTLGLRLVLVDAEPGVSVELGFFGKVPVLDPFS